MFSAMPAGSFGRRELRDEWRGCKEDQELASVRSLARGCPVHVGCWWQGVTAACWVAPCHRPSATVAFPLGSSERAPADTGFAMRPFPIHVLEGSRGCRVQPARAPAHSRAPAQSVHLPGQHRNVIPPPCRAPGRG